MKEFSEENEKTLDEAVKTWGMDAQLNKTEEEAAELIVAIKHFTSGKIELDELIDEIADMEIMIEQLRNEYGHDVVDEKIDTKMDRLRNKLDSINNTDDGEKYMSEPFPDTIQMFCFKCGISTEWELKNKANGCVYSCTHCHSFKRPSNIKMKTIDVE